MRIWPLILSLAVCLSLGCQSAKKDESAQQESAKTDEAPAAENVDNAAADPAPGASADTDKPATAAAGEPAAAPAGATATRLETVQEITFDVPEAWTSTPPTSGMRAAQYTLGKIGDKDLELVIFRFAGGGGGRQANIDRWVGQFQQPDGSSSADKATVDTVEMDPLTVTTVDVSGTYVASMRPGAPAKHNEAGYRMLAAIVEGAGDAFYFKLVGPQDVIAQHQPDFDTLVKSLRKP